MTKHQKDFWGSLLVGTVALIAFSALLLSMALTLAGRGI